MIKAAIFDMDGTLIDSTESDYLAWKKIFEEYNIDFSYEEYKKVLGARGSEIVEKYLDIDPYEQERLLQRKEEYFKASVEEKGLHLVDGVESLLEHIKAMDIKTALATGAGDKKLEYVFQKIGLKNYFDTVVTADDTKTGKPDPEVFLTAAKRLNTLPSECVVFEDAKNGVRAAKSGGMKCVAITTTHDAKSLQDADLVIPSYSKLDIKGFFFKY